MQYKYVIGYLRLSQDDEDKNDESNSIKNQRLLIQQFINGNEEFQGAKRYSFQMMDIAEQILTVRILKR